MDRCPTRSSGIVVAIGATLFGTASLHAAQASNFQIVYDGEGGLPVNGPLIADAAGNLYGEGGATTTASGDVFELLASSGYTKEKVIYQFPLVPYGPSGPSGGLTLTSHNVLLGTTLSGGPGGGGIAFDLGRPSNPSLAILHGFAGEPVTPPDGNLPDSGLAPGPFKHFYGTTILGGVGGGSSFGAGDGIVYYVNASTSDPKYAILHEFGVGADGATPSAATLAVDKQGRLYGVTQYGGTHDLGTVFMLQHVDGGWQEQIIYNFRGGNVLAVPTGNVVLDAQGNLYGCAQGGRHDQGGIFEISPPSQAGHEWQAKVLYTFGHQARDPIAADSSDIEQFQYGRRGCYITRDSQTSLIVGTSFGGGDHGLGTIFTLAPPTQGTKNWTETVGYSFRTGHREVIGVHPTSAPLQVGSVYYGGTFSNASIYAFTP